MSQPSQPLSLPRKVAVILLPCVAAVVLMAVWRLLLLPREALTDTHKLAYAVLIASILIGLGIGLGFRQRLRRQLRTRSRYLLWTSAALYFLAAMYLVLRFSGWGTASVAVSIGCLVAFGTALWGALAERQRTIEYTLFPRRPRKQGQSEKGAKSVKQGV